MSPSSRRSSRTCRSVRPKCCATTSKRRARCDLPTWKPPRRKSWRWPASWPRKAPSHWLARERRLSDSTRSRTSVAELWSLPNVDGPIVGLRRDGPSRARDAEATRASDSARQAELDRGYAAGVSAGRAELQKHNDALAAQVARLDGILNQLSRPLPTLEGEVEQQLVLLAL